MSLFTTFGVRCGGTYKRVGENFKTALMSYEIRLINTWRTIVTSIILAAGLFIWMISILKVVLNEGVFVIMGVPIILGSLIISSILNSKKRNVEINDNTISIDNSIHIKIDQIESCRIGKSFLIDGIIIKMKNSKTYYFHALAFLDKNPNFVVFKEALFNNSFDNLKIPIQTKQIFLRESKFLRYGAKIFIFILVGLFLLSFFTDFKIDKIKILYMSLIALGIFISTRK